MMKDEKTRFSIFSHELDRFISSIVSHLRRNTLYVADHVGQMSFLDRIVTTQHDLNAWDMSVFQLETDAVEWQTLFFRLRSRFAKYLKPGRARQVSLIEFLQIRLPRIHFDIRFHSAPSQTVLLQLQRFDR